jgi:hypothetical protein
MNVKLKRVSAVIRIQGAFVALRIHHKMPMRHIYICGLPGCRIFFHINGTIFDTKLLNTKNVYFDFLHKVRLK